MGQLYSGNLEAFHWAKRHAATAGLLVMVQEDHCPMYMEYTIRLEVYRALDTRQPLITEKFWHRDIDVVYSSATAWLNKQADDYKSWK